MPRFRLILSFAAVILLTACTGGTVATEEPLLDSATDTPSEAGDGLPSDSSSATDSVPTTDTVDTPALIDAPTETASAELVLAPGQRSAPLPIDGGFHNDEARVVAASGRPQLIEMFTFW